MPNEFGDKKATKFGTGFGGFTATSEGCRRTIGTTENSNTELISNYGSHRENHHYGSYNAIEIGKLLQSIGQHSQWTGLQVSVHD